VIIDIIKVIILGIIQGITEWLPISSTGHMILVDEFLKLEVSKEFLNVFLVVIQFGSILAVITLFFKNLFPYGFNKDKEETKNTFYLWLIIIIGCLPAAIVGFFFDDLITDLFFNSWTVAITLIFYGILFIIIENYRKGKKPTVETTKQITIKTALLIGLFQVLALIPGTSRSGATILGGLILGLDRTIAASYTFYLAVPVMAGASLLKVMKFGFNFTGVEMTLLVIGSIVAYIVSILAIRFLLHYIKKNDFKIFGYYRIILGILIIIYFIFN